MRALAAALAVAAAAASVVVPAAAARGGRYIGIMTGRQQVPPVVSTGIGGILAFRDEQTLFLNWSFMGLTTPFDESIGVHIHEGLSGANGPVILSLTNLTRSTCKNRTCGRGTTKLTLSKVQTKALEARGLYINVRTKAFPRGEIRTLIVPRDRDVTFLFASLMTGAANPGNPDGKSKAFGGAYIEVKKGRIVVSGSFERLSGRLAVGIAGGAHMHTGITGMNGPVVIRLKTKLAADGRSGKFLAADNTFTPEPEFIKALEDRRVYLDVHSLKVPQGEIRGQALTGYATCAFTTFLSGSEEVPRPVTTNAIGSVSIEVLALRKMMVTGSFRSLSSPLAKGIAMGAHLHNGVVGANGPVYQPLKSKTFNEGKNGMFLWRDNTYKIPNTSAAIRFLKDNTYVNVHSTKFKSGEIRGQVTLAV